MNPLPRLHPALLRRSFALLTAVLLLPSCSPSPKSEHAGPNGHARHDDAEDHGHAHGHAPTGSAAGGKPEAVAKAAPAAPPSDRAPADTGKESGKSEFCAEHNLPESECGICNPQRLDGLQPGHGVKVRLPSAESARNVGVTVAPPTTGRIEDGIDCLAELAFDENRQAQIGAPVGGIVQAVLVDLGTRVQEKQAVAKIWSSTIAEAVAKAVLTHQTLDRERRLRAERVSSEQDLQQAEANHRAACQQARTLGFTEEQIDAFGATPNEPVLLEVRAPFAGEIVSRSAVRGALVEAGRPLFTVVDRSTLWAILQVPESALDRIEAGLEAELRVDAFPGRTFHGKVTWIGAEVDERTRKVRVRVEIPNPDGRLKARMFGRARILTRRADHALLVPTAALHRVAGRPFVFVRLSEDLFEARAVRVGARSGGLIEIAEGLTGSEAIAVAHGFALKSQLLSSRLGAGCAHE